MIHIEQVKGTLDFFAWVPVVDLLGGDAGECGVGEEELGGVVGWSDVAAGATEAAVAGGSREALSGGFGDAVCLEDLKGFGFGGLEAQGAEGDAQFVVV